MSTFIDPASLKRASPAPSLSDSDSGSARKRPRTSAGASSEDRKEARAHRNRIAAQNSRDRKKAQFAYLEQRVQELEEENRRLRAGAGLPPPAIVPASTTSAHLFAPSSTSDSEHDAHVSHEREQENQELRERIRSLERGWDAVFKALASQGLAPTISPALTSPQTITTTTTFPLPSPAPSFSSLDPEPSPPAPTTVSLPPSPISVTSVAPSATSGTDGEYRFGGVPAAGGLIVNTFTPVVPLGQATVPVTTEESADSTMEALFREILASPTMPNPAVSQMTSSSLGGGDNGQMAGDVDLKEQPKKSNEPQDEQATTTNQSAVNWTSEIEMQHLLDTMVMMNGPASPSADFGSPVDLGLDVADGDFGLAIPTWDVDNVF